MVDMGLSVLAHPPLQDKKRYIYIEFADVVMWSAQLAEIRISD